MNLCLGIEKDDEIIWVEAADPSEVERYEEEEIDGPDLKPMQPSWDCIDSAWNDHLCEIFLDHFKKRQAGNFDFDSDMEQDIEDTFRRRLRTLKRKIRQAKPQKGESRAAANERLTQGKLKALKRQRPNTRRNQVSNAEAVDERARN
jgi:hypothetical protein